MRSSKVFRFFLNVILLAFLVNCGGGGPDGSSIGDSSGGSGGGTDGRSIGDSSGSGGGSGSTATVAPQTPEILSGVAATGIPISGTITLKDANGVQLGPVTTDSDGNYSFDVTGLTPPFLLKAEWSSNSQTYALFSAATTSGIVHLNPFTNLALMLAANSDPSLIFEAQGAKPDTSLINGGSMAAALALIKIGLAPLFNYYGIADFNPISGNYTATPDNRLDALLDVISIEVKNGTITITNKLTHAVIGTSNFNALTSMTIDLTKLPDKSYLTDIVEITQFAWVLCAVMNLGAELTVEKVDGLFIPDPYYRTSNGNSRAVDVKSIVDIFGPNGTNKDGNLRTIRNVRLVQELTADYSAAGRGVSKVFLLNYDFIHENGKVVHGNNVTLGKEISTGQWKFIGDPIQYNAGDNYGGVTETGVSAGNNYGFTAYVVGINSGAEGTSSSISLPPTQ